MKYEQNQVYNIHPKEIVINHKFQPNARDAEVWLSTDDGQCLLEDAKNSKIQNPIHVFVNESEDLELSTGYHRHVAGLAANKEIPVLIVKTPTPLERVEAQVHTNRARNLSALEKGQLCQMWSDQYKEEHGKKPTQKMIANALGFHSPDVCRFLAMASAPVFLQSHIENERISVKEATGIISEVKKEAKKLRKQLDTEYSEKIKNIDPSDSEAIFSLDEEKENKINDFIEKEVKVGYQEFKKAVDSGEKQVGRGRKKGTVKQEKTEEVEKVNNNQESENFSETSFIISSEDEINDILSNFFDALQEVKGMSREEVIGLMQESLAA